MIVSLDNLAHRYHCLPSEVLERGSTFDLYVLDISTRYHQYRSQFSDGKLPAKMPTKDEMLTMLENARKT